jgi:hypothetical protein
MSPLADAVELGGAVAVLADAIANRFGAFDRWLYPEPKLYRFPEKQVDADFPDGRRDEARPILDAVAVYLPPADRSRVLFRMLTEARGSVRLLNDAAVRELAVLPDGTRVPLLPRGRRR